MSMELFKDFDFNLLNDPSFKEDSVREEIIAPILNKLGYSASSENKIIRSKALVHPFVHIGTKANKVNIIPDYLLMKGDKYILALDAKGPNEDIYHGKNVEQAYSYAIHPEIRVTFYGLCNGKDFVIYQITKLDPIISIPIKEIDSRWDEIYRAISPLALTNPDLLDFLPDLGLAWMKMDVNSDMEFLFVATWISSISKLDDSTYTAITTQGIPGEEFIVSLDFSKDLYNSFLACIPNSMKQEVKEGLTQFPFSLVFDEGKMFEITAIAKSSKEVYNNGHEQYCPFIVHTFDPVPPLS